MLYAIYSVGNQPGRFNAGLPPAFDSIRSLQEEDLRQRRDRPQVPRRRRAAALQCSGVPDALDQPGLPPDDRARQRRRAQHPAGRADQRRRFEDHRCGDRSRRASHVVSSSCVPRSLIRTRCSRTSVPISTISSPASTRAPTVAALPACRRSPARSTTRMDWLVRRAVRAQSRHR